MLNLCSPSFDRMESYGQIARELAVRWSALGLRFNLFSHGDLPCDATDTAMRRLLSQPVHPAWGGVLLGYPTNYAAYGPLVQRGPRVAITMFESTALPPGWVEVLNDLDAVITPSTFCRDLFRHAGVTAPVHVVPLGVNEAFHLADRPVDRAPFTFLALADRWRRKGWDAAVLAFDRAFGTDPTYRLIIKARAGAPIEVRHPCVEMCREDLDDERMQALFAATDALVTPSRGEGFYLLPLEYLLTGAPAIVTAWSGPVDYLDLVVPVRYTLADAWTEHERLRGCGQWAEPDVAHLAAQMAHVTRHRDLYTQRAQRAARAVRQRFTWDRFATQVLAIYRGIDEKAKVA